MHARAGQFAYVVVVVLNIQACYLPWCGSVLVPSLQIVIWYRFESDMFVIAFWFVGPCLLRSSFIYQAVLLADSRVVCLCSFLSWWFVVLHVIEATHVPNNHPEHAHTHTHPHAGARVRTLSCRRPDCSGRRCPARAQHKQGHVVVSQLHRVCA